MPGAVPGTRRIRKHLGTNAGLLPGDLLATFVLGAEIPGTTRRYSLPVKYQGAWCLVRCRVHAGSESTWAQAPGSCRVSS